MTLPKYLKAQEKLLAQNVSTNFDVVSALSMADIAMRRLMGWVSGGNEISRKIYTYVENSPSQVIS